MPQTMKAILFDLGGVLIELDGLPIKDHWVDHPIGYDQNWITWGKAQSVIAFETGNMPPEKFPQAVINELALNVSEKAFIDTFTHWPKGYFTGAKALLQALKPHFTLAYYSNTNVYHLPWLREQCKFEDDFAYQFASYEIGYFKPDAAGYTYVAKKMGLPPEHILFIDDNQMNVDGANKAGMQAYKARGIDDVKRILLQYVNIDLRQHE